MNDARGRYVTGRIADFFCVEDPSFGVAKIEEYVAANPSVGEHLQEYLKGTNNKVMVWTYQPPKGAAADAPSQLKMLTSYEEPLTKKLVYVVRNTAPGKAVSTKDADLVQEISVGSIETDFIKHLDEVLSQLFQPVLGAIRTWGKCPNKDRDGFISTITKYLENMNELLEAKPQCIDLNKPPKALVTSITNGGMLAARRL